MGKTKVIACKGCGWDGSIRIWGGRFPPYTRQRGEEEKETDLMKRGRVVPRSWRDGYCAWCVFRRRENRA